jgi:FAD/FMN-containing dehydrogenase
MRAGYSTTNPARLAAFKAQYDPTNVFHLRPNIPPASMGEQGDT